MPIGPTLRAARLDAGLTLTQLSETTRIREHILDAMERDDFAPCRGHFYARGHLRRAAGVLGLDPEPLLAEYDARHVPSAAVPSTLLAASVAAASAAGEERRRPSWQTTGASALVLLMVLAVGGVAVRDEGAPRVADVLVAPAAATPGAAAPAAGAAADPDSAPGVAAPDGELRADTGAAGAAGAATGPPPAEEPATQESEENGGGVSVKLAATDTTWVSVTDGAGDTLYEGTVRKGDRKNFTDDRRVSLVLGNVRGVRLAVNGKRVRLRGEEGEVVRLEYVPPRERADSDDEGDEGA